MTVAEYIDRECRLLIDYATVCTYSASQYHGELIVYYLDLMSGAADEIAMADRRLR